MDLSDLQTPDEQAGPLNADAIYAAMVAIRDYVESPEGQAAYRALLEEKSEKVDFMRSLVASDTDTRVHIRPVFDLTDDRKQEIYPDEPDSVDVGVELARTILFGSSGLVETLIAGQKNQDDPIVVAVCRFIADRAQ